MTPELLKTTSFDRYAQTLPLSHRPAKSVKKTAPLHNGEKITTKATHFGKHLSRNDFSTITMPCRSPKFCC